MSINVRSEKDIFHTENVIHNEQFIISYFDRELTSGGKYPETGLKTIKNFCLTKI